MLAEEERKGGIRGSRAVRGNFKKGSRKKYR